MATRDFFLWLFRSICTLIWRGRQNFFLREQRRWENFSAGWNYYPILLGWLPYNSFVFNGQRNGKRDAI